MQSNSAPNRFPIAFAAQAGTPYKRAIPAASQSGVTPGAASLTDGFPPENFIPLRSGGIAFSGQDVNGLFNQVTAVLQWIQAGGPMVYDATFQAAIGGYPLGARVVSAANPATMWRSNVEANSTNPDAGGAGWGSDTDGLAPLADPDFSGSPTAPTAPDGDSSGLLANTAWVTRAANEIAAAYAATIRVPSAGATYAGPGTYVWTVPAGVHIVKATVTGGGAGGNGCDGSQSGSGGGAGGTSVGYIGVSPGQQLAVTVGAGGASGYNQSGAQTNSGGGGSSSFGIYLSATGGGPAGLLAGSGGGSGYGGHLQLQGGCGTDASPGTTTYGGLGGASSWGGGGRAATSDAPVLNGQAPGSGGGGGYGGASAGYGGAGANGIVVIEY